MKDLGALVTCAVTLVGLREKVAEWITGSIPVTKRDWSSVLSMLSDEDFQNAQHIACASMDKMLAECFKDEVELLKAESEEVMVVQHLAVALS